MAKQAIIDACDSGYTDTNTIKNYENVDLKKLEQSVALMTVVMKMLLETMTIKRLMSQIAYHHTNMI